MVFTTGRGSCFGCKPCPSIKVATNTPMYEHMIDDMDINAGVILDGTPRRERRPRNLREDSGRRQRRRRRRASSTASATKSSCRGESGRRCESQPICRTATTASLTAPSGSVLSLAMASLFCSARHATSPNLAEGQAKTRPTSPRPARGAMRCPASLRFPRMISFMRGKEISKRAASDDWLIPIGLRNSSSNISPG